MRLKKKSEKKKEMPHTREIERQRERYCSLCIVHCRHLLVWQLERKGCVCLVIAREC